MYPPGTGPESGQPSTHTRLTRPGNPPGLPEPVAIPRTPQVSSKELDGQQNRYLHKIAGRVKSRCTVGRLCSDQVVSKWVEYHLKLTAGKVVVALYAMLSVSKVASQPNQGCSWSNMQKAVISWEDESCSCALQMCQNKKLNIHSLQVAPDLLSKKTKVVQILLVQHIKKNRVSPTPEHLVEIVQYSTYKEIISWLSMQDHKDPHLLPTRVARQAHEIPHFYELDTSKPIKVE
ncbi:hypothetical protein B0H14DRAFT_2573431 [Mycena olivaceomarginata]|nr:hypothetical protein B0H14DRAFT_2573431 [Mycena olivaceomarginata]